MKTEINIDKLVLHGFSKREVFYIRRAVQRSLTGMIERRGLSNQKLLGAQTPRLAAPEIRIQKTNRPEVTGRAIARSIYQGLIQPPINNAK